MSDKVQKWTCRAVGSSLAAFVKPLGHRQNVASLSFFDTYYFGRSLSELAQLMLLPYSRGKSTRYSHKCKDVYVNSLFPCTAILWNSLPIECICLPYGHMI